MEALLPSVLADVIAPLHLARSLVNRVEVAGTRTDEEKFPHDRGGREDSAACLILPAKFWSNRGGNHYLIGVLRAAHSCDRN